MSLKSSSSCGSSFGMFSRRIPDGDREHDQIVTLDTERELSHWLQKTSLQNILGHFDAEEYVYLKNKDKN